MYRIKPSRFEHSTPALDLNPQVVLYRIRTWLHGHLLNRFKDPSLLFRKLSWSGTCINQWPPGKTMSCQKQLDKYIFKAPKFEIGRILAVQNQDLFPCAPNKGGNRGNPCIKRWGFGSLTYLILCRKFPGGYEYCTILPPFRKQEPYWYSVSFGGMSRTADSPSQH